MRDEVRVGAFVALAATLLLLMTLWILGRGVLGGGPHYVVRLPHAGGVIAGDRVRVAGVETGRVDSVWLDAGAALPVRVEVSRAASTSRRTSTIQGSSGS